jgi:hypothetical protein
MTHDELLEFLNKDINEGGFVSAIGEWFPARSLFALRAVVKLHKVQKCDCNCSRTHEPICDECIEDYPCPTIQAIERELTNG